MTEPWKNVLWVLESLGEVLEFFCKQDSGNPDKHYKTKVYLENTNTLA